MIRSRIFPRDLDTEQSSQPAEQQVSHCGAGEMWGDLQGIWPLSPSQKGSEGPRLLVTSCPGCFLPRDHDPASCV